MSPLPTKLLMNWEDITTDHRDVPAFEMDLHGDQQVFGWPVGFSVSSCWFALTKEHLLS